MKAKRTRWLAACALIAYGGILIRLIVFKAIPTIHIGRLRLRFAGTRTGPANLIPFKTILAQLTGGGHRLIAVVNLLGNILPFMPVGFLLPLVLPSISWQKGLVLAVFTGLTVEVLEVIFQVGIFDVDDLVLNALGVMLGYRTFVLLRASAVSSFF